MEPHPNHIESSHTGYSFAEALETMTPEITHPQLTDLSLELPEIADYLLPNERIVEHPTTELHIPAVAPDVDEVLAKLTGSPNTNEIGLHGPSLASLAYELGEDNPDQGKFAVLFGRDSQMIAELLEDEHPELMRTTLLKLATHQSNTDDPMADQEKGKIIHELRFAGDETADKITAERGWKWPYYGTVDSTLMFIKNVSQIAETDPAFLDETFQHHGSAEGDLTTMRQALEQALEWAISCQDKGDTGLIEFQRRNPQGIENPILRDSADSMTDKSGRLANHDRPIAALQAQVNGYDAFADAADLYQKLAQSDPNDASLHERATDYRRRAQHLHDQVIDKFWIEDERGGFLAVAVDRDDDGNLHQLDTRTNDMAFALDSRLLESPRDSEKVDKLVATLLSDEMRVGSGLRSLSSQEKHYLPGGYHTGSDWYVVDAFFARGLERHDYKDEARAVYEHIASVPNATNCYPEYGIGNSDTPRINTEKIITSTSPTSDHEELNVRMQPPETMQGWTVAAVKYAQLALTRLDLELAA